MIALWMVYATVIGGLLAAAALAVEQLAAMRGLPRRWVWLAAMLALPVLPLLAPAWRPTLSMVTAPLDLRGVPVSGATSDVTGRIAGHVATSNPSPSASGATTTTWIVGRARAAVTAASQWAWTGLIRLIRYDRWLLIGWATGTALLLASYATITARLAYRRRRWLTTWIDGDAVLVAPDVGPAVVGTLQPAIVLPAWSVSIDPALRALIVRHEREHLRARDPLLLHVVTLAAYLVPWNLPVWWMLRRLRLAIEVDCDRRVLRAGGDARRYADLLLTVGSRRSRALRVLAPALAEGNSLLARRIGAMFPGREWSQFRYLRVAGCAGSAYLLIAAASAVPKPERAPAEHGQTLATGAPRLATANIMLVDSATMPLVAPPVIHHQYPTEPSLRAPLVLPTLVSRANAPKRSPSGAVTMRIDSASAVRSLTDLTPWIIVPRHIWVTTAKSDSLLRQAIEIRPVLRVDSSTIEASLRLELTEVMQRQVKVVGLEQGTAKLKAASGKPAGTKPQFEIAIGDSSGQLFLRNKAGVNLLMAVDSTQSVERFIPGPKLHIVLDSTKVQHLLP